MGGIFAGDQLTCALAKDGALKCWGDFSVEEKFQADPTPSAELALVPLGSNTQIRQLVAGGHHMCVQAGPGEVFCFGENGYGEPAATESTPSSVGRLDAPQRLVDFGTHADVAQIVSGNQHNCALFVDGTVKCWDDRSGQKPRGDWPAIPLPAPATQLAAGRDETCAALVDGRVVCWNRFKDADTVYPAFRTHSKAKILQLLASQANDYAQLEDQSVVFWPHSCDHEYCDKDGYSLLESPDGQGVRNMVTSKKNICIRFRDGTASCAGSHDFVKSGDNFAAYAEKVSFERKKIASMYGSASSARVCFELDDGTVRCRWDDDEVAEFEVPFPQLPGPVRQLAMNPRQICALGDDGCLRCTNATAQSTSNSAAVDAPELAFQNVTSVSVGTNHVCFIQQDGTLLCADENLGRLRASTAKYQFGEVELPEKAKQASTARNATCALLADGSVRCWRRRHAPAAFAPLPQPKPFAPADPPALVSLPHPSTAIASGGNQSCAISDQGEVTCWQETGAGNKERGLQKVLLKEKAVELAVTWDDMNCARLESGVVSCWKLDSTKKNPTADVLPFRETTQHAVSISAGLHDVCAIWTSDEVTCWNQYESAMHPVRLPPGRRAIQISAGLSHVCVLLDDATATCWGNNDHGQLGVGRQQPVDLTSRKATFRPFR